MNDQLAATFHGQIRSLLEQAIEQLGKPDESDPRGAILAAERIIAQAAASATGYRAIAAKPGHF